MSQSLSLISHGNYAVTIFLDLAKVLNCVYDPTLLQNMSLLGIKASELEWFESFLNKRTQRAVINNKQSEELSEKPFGAL